MQQKSNDDDFDLQQLTIAQKEKNESQTMNQVEIKQDIENGEIQEPMQQKKNDIDCDLQQFTITQLGYNKSQTMSQSQQKLETQSVSAISNLIQQNQIDDLKNTQKVKQATISQQHIAEIMSYWFNPNNTHEENIELWFKKGKELDAEISNKFKDLLDQAADSSQQQSQATLLELASENIENAIALIVLFDQFPRHIYRDSARAFHFDKLALALSKQFVQQNVLNRGHKLIDQYSDHLHFSVMPFMHSEDLKDNNMGKMALEMLIQGAQDSQSKFRLDAIQDQMEKHRKVLERFGRYPMRNQALGRDSTEDELIYVKINQGKPF